MTPSIKIPVIAYPGPGYARIRKGIIDNRDKREAEVMTTTATIVAKVRSQGDAAIIEYTKKFDGISLTAKALTVNAAVLSKQATKASPELRKSIIAAAQHIKAYHQRQSPQVFSLDTKEGTLAQIVKPVTRAGVYIPGGYTSYPSTVLMTVIPAQIAGVKQIAAVFPFKGEMDPAVAFALTYLGITEIYHMGGVQAIAGLAYGTKTVKPVDIIVGPGNPYVAMAKKLCFGKVGIDSIAGPSEVVILADTSANPRWVALDLLSQAEHGSGDESAWLVTESTSFAQEVHSCLLKEMAASPVKNIFTKLAPNALAIFVTPSRSDSITFVNQCAPEHLEIQTRTALNDLKKIENAGAIFLGNHTPVALGDYFIGTNHVLPTGSGARFASPLGVETFLKRMSVAHITEKGLALAAPHVSRLARAEKFVHHALSVEARLAQ